MTIGISIPENIKKESVLINAKVPALDRVKKIRDADGNVTEVIVEKAGNIITSGASRKHVAKQVYGRF